MSKTDKIRRIVEAGETRATKIVERLAKRGVTVDVSQGQRSLGSFTLVGSCRTHISYGVTIERCRFKGRQPWLFRNGF